MSLQQNLIEFDYYIPPDVTVDDDGNILDTDWPNVYQFSNGVDQFQLSFTGMGMPPINYITQKGPFQHGQTVLDYRLMPRTVQYIHRRKACGRQAYWDARADIMNLLRVNRQVGDSFEPGRLRKIQPDGTTRDIFALIEQGPIFTARDTETWDEWAFTETLRFICHDPTFFDPAVQQVSWEVIELDGLIFFESPDWEDHLTFPIVFGSDAISASETITYAGTWLSYPTIEIRGPINQPLIKNTSIDEKVELNYNVPNGETVTIDLSFGNKTVISSAGINLIGTVTSDSDLATFHIAPDPEATGGINIINGSGSGGAATVTAIVVSYNTRYIGI